MKQTLIPIVCALAFAGVARGADADGSVLFGGRAWRLSPECRLEGSILTVTVPKDKARGLHAAVTTVDLAPFAPSGFEAMIRVRGQDVTVPPKPYNGVKFMFHFRPLGGADRWPGATLPTGNFDWSRAAEAVRTEDTHTPIIIESNVWDSPKTFQYLSPLTLTNIIYQAHLYMPMDFTHQRVKNRRKFTVAYPNAEKG